MTTIQYSIQAFVKEANHHGWIDDLDQIYVINRLLDLLQLDDLSEVILPETLPTLLTSMDEMRQYALEHGIIEDDGFAKEAFEATVMDFITPLPSAVNQLFWDIYEVDKIAATDYFYSLSKANDYIKTRHIAKNIAFESQTQYGALEITINLSKPEKDPKDIAKAKLAKASNYPKCLLCLENEGYKGRANHPARQNHRVVRLDLNGKTYGMQYSPYVYFNEHSIFFNELHIPMQVDRRCFDNLLEIVEILPHYFAGSNADLPIVGGSILSHDHYQGGRHVFPMEKAESYEEVTIDKHPKVKAHLVKWPMSVIRLSSPDKIALANAAEDVLYHWREYSDESANVLAFTDETPHNTITPIARRRDDLFEMDLVLRNNRTTEKFPDGIFHPHQDVQHIKKENIGLIEVMGLAILPARLVQETRVIKDYLLDQSPLDEVPHIHQQWAIQLKQTCQVTEEDSVEAFIQEEIGKKFARVLEDAGVFKQDEQGIAAIKRFVAYVNS